MCGYYTIAIAEETNPNFDIYNVKCTPYVAGVPESQISVRFVLRPAVFELQAILKQEHRMSPNDLEPY